MALQCASVKLACFKLLKPVNQATLPMPGYKLPPEGSRETEHRVRKVGVRGVERHVDLLFTTDSIQSLPDPIHRTMATKASYLGQFVLLSNRDFKSTSDQATRQI